MTAPATRLGFVARPHLRPAVAAAAVALAALSAGCTGHSAASTSAPPTTEAAGGAPSPSTSVPTTTPPAAQPVTVVDDQGATFRVTATPVSPSLIVTVGNGVWSASPGHQFLQEELSVSNPTSTAESLTGFDDPTTGLADGLELVLQHVDALRFGYGIDCGAEPGLASTLCPISFGEGLTVDSDSVGSGKLLAPGASAHIAVSYGPVPDDLDPAALSVWFVPAQPGPNNLSG